MSGTGDAARRGGNVPSGYGGPTGAVRERYGNARRSGLGEMPHTVSETLVRSRVKDTGGSAGHNGPCPAAARAATADISAAVADSTTPMASTLPMPARQDGPRPARSRRWGKAAEGAADALVL